MHGSHHTASSSPENSSYQQILGVAAIVVLLYIFLVSIDLMGTAFKLFGKDLAQNILSLTSNPFAGLFVGILTTSLVQSSSTTTAMVVTMVAGGALTVPNAIPIIMGANIGTSVTNTIVSMGHMGRKQEFERAFAASTVHDFFNFLAVIILFPIQYMTNFLGILAEKLAVFFHGAGGLSFTSPIKLIITPVTKFIVGLAQNEPLIVGLLCLFTALKYMVTLLRSEIIQRLEGLFDGYIFKTTIRAFLFGLIITATAQSSSITTSVVVPLAGAGVLTLIQIYPYTLGANVGTTVTAILASLVSGTVEPNMRMHKRR
ncbi:MAG: Na/Pi symporter [Pseudomonadota bacterium]